MTTMTLQPVLPSLSVTLIESEADAKKYGELLREQPESFPGILRQYGGLRQYRVTKVAGTTVEAGSEQRVDVFGIGDYFVESNNGKRHFTKDKGIRNGFLDGIPVELLQPTMAHRSTGRF